MKRFFILFGLLFSTVVFADTITINWGVDNQTYTTTTCQSGNDVILPATPTKRGHVFRGWTAEHFNRGTFTNWVAVPTTETGYLQNTYGNRTPLNGDYIIVNNAIGYSINFNNPIYIKVVKNAYGANEWKLSVDNGEEFKVSRAQGYILTKQYEDFELRFEVNTTSVQIYSNINMKYNDVVVSAGDPIISFSYNVSNGTEYIMYYNASGIDFSGTWRFVYDGIWGIDGKSGWKPVEQIISE